MPGRSESAVMALGGMEADAEAAAFDRRDAGFCHGLLGQGAQRVEDFRVIRKSSRVMLREHDTAVDDDIENAAMALFEFDIDAELVADFGRQTGGLGQVASSDAIDDRNLHGSRWLILEVSPG